MRQAMISNEELDELLLGCYNRAAASAWKQAGAVFHCLYNHGFRINELKDIHTWHITTTDLIIAKTSKNNVWREIPVEDMHPLVIHSIEEGNNHVFTHSYRTYDRYFQQKIGISKLTVQSKNITTHLF
ncbi:MAG: hypothetical protein GY751_03990, partial [Bacteroidetes bacterium]|nr:hypothetical protein [Bacteroidota bacterium]